MGNLSSIQSINARFGSAKTTRMIVFATVQRARYVRTTHLSLDVSPATSAPHASLRFAGSKRIQPSTPTEATVPAQQQLTWAATSSPARKTRKKKRLRTPYARGNYCHRPLTRPTLIACQSSKQKTPACRPTLHPQQLTDACACTLRNVMRLSHGAWAPGVHPHREEATPLPSPLPTCPIRPYSGLSAGGRRAI